MWKVSTPPHLCSASQLSESFRYFMYKDMLKKNNKKNIVLVIIVYMVLKMGILSVLMHLLPFDSYSNQETWATHGPTVFI